MPWKADRLPAWLSLPWELLSSLQGALQLCVSMWVRLVWLLDTVLFDFLLFGFILFGCILFGFILNVDFFGGGAEEQRLNLSHGSLQSRVDVYLARYPDSTSLKNMLHWRQVTLGVPLSLLRGWEQSPTDPPAELCKGGRGELP